MSTRERTMYNISLFAEKVMPNLRDLWDDEWEDKWWIKPDALRHSARPSAPNSPGNLSCAPLAGSGVSPVST